MARKNILFITADQWRGDCLSALAHPHVKTPNIDALIKDGIAFDNHYSVCVPCAPARASLLTGMYLQNHRVTRNGTPLDDRHTNIARELRQAGYIPTLFGYTDTALDPRVFSKEEVLKDGYEGMMSGFEEGLLLPGEKPEKWLSWLRDKGYAVINCEEAFSTEFSDQNTGSSKAAYAPAYKAEHSQTAYITEKVIDHIDTHLEHTQDSWCIHLSYLRPHPPFVAPEPYNKMYDPSLIKIEDLDAFKESADEHPWLKAARSPLGDWPEEWIQRLANNDDYESDIAQLRATYYGLISKVDYYIGQLINHLKVIGEYQNTLIVLTSDHGELMGDHGLFGKRGYFKEAYHVPLIIVDPQQLDANRGQLEHSITESVDIMPTILEWTKQPIPRQCDGKSLLPFVKRQQPQSWRKEAHWEYDFYDVKSPELERFFGIDMHDCKLNVISNEDYMYIHFANLPSLFFDLKNDPQTKNNVIEDPKYAKQVLMFSQRLLSWRMQNDERILTAYSVSRDEIYYRESNDVSC